MNELDLIYRDVATRSCKVIKEDEKRVVCIEFLTKILKYGESTPADVKEEFKRKFTEEERALIKEEMKKLFNEMFGEAP